jgi:hypothetical protein
VDQRSYDDGGFYDHTTKIISTTNYELVFRHSGKGTLPVLVSFGWTTRTLNRSRTESKQSPGNRLLPA